MSNEIDKIAADEEVIMTSSLKRAFLTEGCDPACHCCKRKIEIGETFKLAFMVTKNPEQASKHDNNQDEMLCSECSPQMLIDIRKKQHSNEVIRRNKPTWGFSRRHCSRDVIRHLREEIDNW